MQIDWFTFAAQLINFVILLGLLSKFLYRPIINAMDAREKRISDRLKEARTEREEAENEKKLYESKKLSLEKKEDELLQKAKEEVAEQRKAWLHEARTKVEQTQKEWKEAIERERDAFIQQFKEEAGKQTMDMARKIMRDLANADLESQAIKHFLSQLHERTASEQDLMLNEIKKADQPLIIKSGFELPSKYRKEIEQELQRLTNGSIKHEYEVDENLGFGIEMHTDGWKIAWSLQSYLDELENRIRSTYQSKFQ